MKDKYKHIIEEYKDKKETYELLGQLVYDKLTQIAKSSGIRIYKIDMRVKEEQSLVGKLERKGDKYDSLSDITDILGLRLVCFFADDVDKITKKIESAFAVDWDQSIDKRKILDVRSFGYLSVHYICSIKNDGSIEPGLEKLKFEVQTCSIMQHIWAVMEHDLGYKTKFGIPRTVVREFSRLAGLLEIADEQFSRIRDSVKNYTEEVHNKIANDEGNEILLDSVSLDEFMTCNKKMRLFLEEISKKCNAEIFDTPSENYITQLTWLRKDTIGDVQQMLEDNSRLALYLAERTLIPAKLDILSSTVALRFLCLAELINKEYSKKQVSDFFFLWTKNREKAEQQSNELIGTAEGFTL